MLSPKICLCLTGTTIEEDLKMIEKYRNWIDLVELRVDYLSKDERLAVRNFPQAAGLPCILTIRRRIDGGNFVEGEASRTTLFARALAFADQDSRKNFAYVDFEDDFNVPSLQDAALAFGTKVIRSYHDMNGPVLNLAERMQKMRITGYEIPKIASMANSLSDLTKIYKASKEVGDFDHIITVMGPFGQPSRILASQFGSYLTYTSPEGDDNKLKVIGHTDPKTLNEVYNFKLIDKNTRLYGITGFPLSITDSPKIHNKGYREHGMNAVYFPMRAENVDEVIEFADTVGVQGFSVTVPHKESILSDLQQISAEVGEVGACNTVVKRSNEWIGFNTDTIGLQKALENFLGTKRLAHKRVAIIGAGGAARAAAYIVKQMHGKACIFNRTVSKAKKIADHYGFKYAALDADATDILSNYNDLIIQTTSIGMGANVRPDSEGRWPLPAPETDPLYFYNFSGNEMIYDVIYKPEKTPLLVRAERAGCKVENGYSMLLNQAYAQFSIFTGVEYE